MTEFLRPFMPPSRSERAAEWRRNFIEAATADVLATLRKIPIADAKRLVLRSPVQPTRAADLPSDSITRFVSLAPSSTIARLASLSTRVDLTGTTLTIPLPNNWAAATFIPEGAPIPVRQFHFSGLSIGPVHKLALLTALSAELETASGNTATAIMGSLLENAIRKGADGVLLSDSPATADAPSGLLNGLTPIAGSADMSKDLAALVAAIGAAGLDTTSIAFICSPSQALSLSLQAGPHFAHKIIESSTLETGTIVAVATSALIFVGEGTPKIDLAKQTLLHHADPASQISVTGTPNIISEPVVSTFQSDLVALRCIARISWNAIPGSVSVVNGATW